jgi:hypothetical protein
VAGLPALMRSAKKMKPLLNSRMQEELELERPASSLWERVFRIGLSFLIVSTLVGVVAEWIFGKRGMDLNTHPWMWGLTVPYFLFMIYCSNYAVARFVKNRIVKIAWFLLVAFIALLIVASQFAP